MTARSEALTPEPAGPATAELRVDDYRHDDEGARVYAAVHPAEHEGRFWRAYCPTHTWAGPWRLFRARAVEDVIEHGV